MQQVANTAKISFVAKPGLDDDGMPGTEPSDAVYTWSVEPVNGGTQAPVITADPNSPFAATVDFAPGKTGDQWIVQLVATSAGTPEFHAVGQTPAYEIQPGLATTFVIEQQA